MNNTKPDQHKSGFTYEPGYGQVLLRRETKEQLSAFHKSLGQRDLFRECRIVTAAIEMALEDAQNDPVFKERLIERTKTIVTRDMNQTED